MVTEPHNHSSPLPGRGTRTAWRSPRAEETGSRSREAPEARPLISLQLLVATTGHGAPTVHSQERSQNELVKNSNWDQTTPALKEFPQATRDLPSLLLATLRDGLCLTRPHSHLRPLRPTPRPPSVTPARFLKPTFSGQPDHLPQNCKPPAHCIFLHEGQTYRQT